MPDPFATALTALFRAPGSVAAVYSPLSGPDVPLRVIRTNGREVEGSLIMDTEAVQIMVADVAQPQAGARITIGSEISTIQSAPQLDRERLTWSCYLEPA